MVGRQSLVRRSLFRKSGVNLQSPVRVRVIVKVGLRFGVRVEVTLKVKLGLGQF